MVYIYYLALTPNRGIVVIHISRLVRHVQILPQHEANLFVFFGAWSVAMVVISVLCLAHGVLP